jgi:hypothetical protein
MKKTICLLENLALLGNQSISALKTKETKAVGWREFVNLLEIESQEERELSFIAANVVEKGMNHILLLFQNQR